MKPSVTILVAMVLAAIACQEKSSTEADSGLVWGDTSPSPNPGDGGPNPGDGGPNPGDGGLSDGPVDGGVVGDLSTDLGSGDGGGLDGLSADLGGGDGGGLDGLSADLGSGDGGGLDDALDDSGADLEPGPDVEPEPDVAPEPEVVDPPGCDPSAPGTGLAVASAPSFAVAVSQPSPIFRTLTNNGKQHYPDSAVTLRNTGGSWEVILAAGRETYRLTGPSPTSVSMNPVSPVLAPTDNPADPHQGYAGITSLTTCNGVLTAFFHAEYHAVPVAPWPDCPAPYHASMGRATLAGGGSFQVDSPAWVLTSSGTAGYGAPKCAYGAGGGSIFDPGGDYLYLYYYDWDSPNGLYLARSCRDDCGVKGSWRKWNNGSFSGEAFSGSFLQPSGPSSSILPAGAGSFDAFTVVSYNSYLNGYLMVAATESGIALRGSADGINWGPRVPVLEHLQPADVLMWVLYPTVVDAGSWGREQTGRHLKLIHATVCDDLGKQASHRAFVADLELTKAGDVKTVSYDRRKLVRYYHAANPADHWCTTGSAPGYGSEGGLGKMAANSIPGTHPLYDCVQGKDHVVSQSSHCEGGTSLGIMGYAWSAPGAGLHAIHRCWMSTSEGHVDHFVSMDPGCEGLNSEGVIGYLE